MQALLIALLVLGAQSRQAGQPSQPSPQDVAQPREATTPRRLIITYSDGRTSPHLLRPRGGSWTPKFPRQPNPPPHAGLQLSALQVDFEVDRDVVITVSLKYGTPHQKTVQVATVRLGAEPVRVIDLERYGVDPIMLSLDDYSPSPLVQPTVTSASPLLDVTVDLMRHDVPAYKITFRNRAARAIMAVSFRMFRGEKEVLSGRRKTNRSTPIVDAAGEYMFTLQVTTGETPGFDRFDVKSVLWDDGSVEGDPELRISERELTFGHAQQLRLVMAILQDAAPANDSSAEPKSLGQVRGAVQALPIVVDAADATLADGISQHALSVKIGKQQVLEAVLQDLDDYVRTHGGNTQAPARHWISEAQSRYASWLGRTLRLLKQ
jgi:hypothetical protein